jgi:hypothetical protein
MNWNDLYRLLEASGEQDAQAAARPESKKECRVYHNGTEIVQVVIGPDWPTTDLKWIPVDPGQFEKISNLTHCIVENSIVGIDFSSQRIVQLEKSTHGPYRTVRGMSTVLLGDNENYEFVQYYNNRHS